jgi:hypothetical protein
MRPGSEADSGARCPGKGLGHLGRRSLRVLPRSSVNGGVKAGQRGGAKPGQFAAWALGTTHLSALAKTLLILRNGR